MLKFLKWAGLSLLGTVVSLTLLGMAGFGAPDVTDLETCRSKGRAYYKEIGSYPTLSDGRAAEGVIANKCGRYGGTFD